MARNKKSKSSGNLPSGPVRRGLSNDSQRPTASGIQRPPSSGALSLQGLGIDRPAEHADGEITSRPTLLNVNVSDRTLSALAARSMNEAIGFLTLGPVIPLAVRAAIVMMVLAVIVSQTVIFITALATCTGEETVLMVPRRAVEVWCNGVPRWLCPDRSHWTHSDADPSSNSAAPSSSCVDLVCSRSFVARPFCELFLGHSGRRSGDGSGAGRGRKSRTFSQRLLRALGFSRRSSFGEDDDGDDGESDEDLHLTQYDTILNLCEARPGLQRCRKLGNFSTSVILVDAFTLAAEHFIDEAQQADEFDQRLIAAHQIVGMLDTAHRQEFPDASLIQQDLVKYLDAGHESVVALRALRARIKAETEWFERRLNFLANAQPQRQYTSGIELLSRQLVEEVADHMEHLYEKALQAVQKTEHAYEAMAVFDRAVSRREIAGSTKGGGSSGESDLSRRSYHSNHREGDGGDMQSDNDQNAECAGVWCKIAGATVRAAKVASSASFLSGEKSLKPSPDNTVTVATTEQLLKKLANTTHIHHRAARDMFEGVKKISEDCRSYLTHLERLRPNPALSWKLVKEMLEKIQSRNRIIRSETALSDREDRSSKYRIGR